MTWAATTGRRISEEIDGLVIHLESALRHKRLDEAREALTSLASRAQWAGRFHDMVLEVDRQTREELYLSAREDILKAMAKARAAGPPTDAPWDDTWKAGAEAMLAAARGRERNLRLGIPTRRRDR